LRQDEREVVRYRATHGRQALLRAIKAILDAGEALHAGDEVVVVEPGDDGRVEVSGVRTTVDPLNRW
jgi:archaeosine-15-forming tRNA-guanine transglycosylase